MNEGRKENRKGERKEGRDGQRKKGENSGRKKSERDTGHNRNQDWELFSHPQYNLRVS